LDGKMTEKESGSKRSENKKAGYRKFAGHAAMLLCVMGTAFVITACAGSTPTQAAAADHETAEAAQTETVTAQENTDQKETDAAAQEEGQQSADAHSTVKANEEENVSLLITPEEKERIDFLIETPEDAQQYAIDNEFTSCVLEEDGSVSITMTKSRHEELMETLRDAISLTSKDKAGSEYYPNIVNVEFNDDFTEFTVTTKSETVEVDEYISALDFFYYGWYYNIFNGTPAENIHVDYINEATGEVIESADSMNMEQYEEMVGEGFESDGSEAEFEEE